MLNDPSNPSLILTLFLFDVTFFKRYYMVCCASHMQSKHCVRSKNSTEIFMAYQCSDLTGTAIKKWKLGPKGRKCISYSCLAIPAALKKAHFFFTPPLNLRLSPRSLLPGTWCCQVTAEPSLCVLLFQDLQQANLPPITSFILSLSLSLSPLFVLHEFHEHVLRDLPLCGSVLNGLI